MKLIIVLLIFLSSFTLGACAKTEYEGELIKKNIPLEALGKEYTIKDDSITTYFYPDGTVPLVGIDEFISSLDGYFESNRIRRSDGFLFNSNITYSWAMGRYDLQMKVNYNDDIISVNDMYFFSFTHSIGGVDFTSHFKSVDYWSSGRNSKSFDLAKYGFDILSYNEEILVPINILNTLFLSPATANLIYNGDKFIFIPHYIDDKYIEPIRSSSKTGSMQALDFRKASNNGLYFTMDYFYGLNKIKGINNSFEEYLKANRIDTYNRLNSLDPKENEIAYLEIFINMLDELHSLPEVKSYLLDTKDAYYMAKDYMGSFRKSFYETRDILKKNYAAVVGENILDVYNTYGNTAFIKFNSFDIGWDEDIYDDNHNLLEDAWKYDTFIMLDKLMKRIDADPSIKNIVIDLSANGGGYVAAMINALGFLTNEDIVYSLADSLTGYRSASFYRVDTNGDGAFDELDGYKNYNWNVLISPNTFSAANTFSSICKDMKLATILGKPSGGGMCSVMQHALLDGTILRISSNSCIQGFTKTEDNKLRLHDIEKGISPDYEIEYDYFYDYKYLDSFINNGYQAL